VRPDRTRTALLEAARALIREKGYEGTTLEDVATRAGMTTGAIYGNFKNRAELFVALGQKYWKPVVPKISPGATFAEAMQALAKATLAAVDERAPVAVGRLTGLAYTLQNRELSARVHEITKSSYETGARWLRSFDPAELPMPPNSSCACCTRSSRGWSCNAFSRPNSARTKCSTRRSQCLGAGERRAAPGGQPRRPANSSSFSTAPTV
jgi:hypothetical protein